MLGYRFASGSFCARQTCSLCVRVSFRDDLVTPGRRTPIRHMQPTQGFSAAQGKIDNDNSVLVDVLSELTNSRNKLGSQGNKLGICEVSTKVGTVAVRVTCLALRGHHFLFAV